MPIFWKYLAIDGWCNAHRSAWPAGLRRLWREVCAASVVDALIFEA